MIRTGGKSRLRFSAAVLFGAMLAGCGGGGGDTSTPLVETPLSVDAWVLTGSSVDARSASINSLTIDASSSAAITRSAAAILTPSPSQSVASLVTSSVSPDTTIDFTAPGTAVSPLFHSLNLGWYSKHFTGLSLYRELISQIRVDMLRFPGGQERGYFDATKTSLTGDWDLATGAYQFTLTGEEVSNYIAMCRQLGIEAQIEVNLYNDDPEMARSLVDYVVNTLGYDLKYVSMGNEPEINNANSWSYMQATTTDQALATYLSRYQSYAKAIRSVKPDITLIFGEFTAASSSQIDTMFKSVGSLSASPPGAYSRHWYPFGNYGQASYSPDYPQLSNLLGGSGLATVDQLKAIQTSMKAQQDQYFGSGKLIVGEWGPSWSGDTVSEPTEDSIATVLFSAEAHETGKSLGFDSMQWFSLSDSTKSYPWTTALIAVDESNNNALSVRPQYYLHFLYKHLWGDVSARINGNNRTDKLSVYASRSGNTNYLMLINRTADKTQDKLVTVVTSSGKQNLHLYAPPHSVTVIRI